MSVQRALALSCSQISSSYDPGNGQNLYETTGRQQNKDKRAGSQSLSLFLTTTLKSDLYAQTKTKSVDTNISPPISSYFTGMNVTIQTA